MSKMRTPSQYVPAALCSAVAVWLLQVSSERRESTDRNSRRPLTLMSFCDPGQTSWTTSRGRRLLAML
jgi:hypothetical protein